MVQITGNAPPVGTVGDLYTFTVTATGDNPPIHWAADGTLPAGLQLDASTGILSG
ncbi:MAG: putative Ig domain-containing protein, partial [Streptosporangiaceae bacterium]